MAYGMYCWRVLRHYNELPVTPLYNCDDPSVFCGEIVFFYHGDARQAILSFDSVIVCGIANGNQS